MRIKYPVEIWELFILYVEFLVRTLNSTTQPTYVFYSKNNKIPDLRLMDLQKRGHNPRFF